MRPRLAVNYSPALISLLLEGRLTIDLFKVPDWGDLIVEATSHGPAYVHFPTELGATKLGVDVDRCMELMEETDTNHLNAHLVPSRERFPHLEVGSVDADTLDEVAEALLVDVAELARAVGSDRVIVENVPYRGPDHGLLRAGVEPDVITRVVEESGCGLLLDLSHAVLTADELSIDVWTYLDALPTHALRELHVSGVRKLEGRLRDHLPLTEDDVELLRGAMARASAGAWPMPDVVSFEYGGVGPVFDWRTEPDVLAEQVPLLHAIVKGERAWVPT
ncbi:MAG TPA: DUF692 family protein [Trueperaceae bacterium]|nr:DUF692 family protein [Trueperaceae bacterium]